MNLKSKYLRPAAGLLLTALLLLPVKAAPSVSAKSALVMDAATGEVLYEKNADAKSLIASTTKIMTGLLIAETCPLGLTVSVPPEAAGLEGSSLYLKAGEEISLEALMYGMMLRSGNDAAAALAICLDGSVEAFAARMNRRAGELGLRATRFSNPHGLDSDENYSTARDLARLAAHALENDVFRQVCSAKSYARDGRSFANHNKLLWQYPGCIGVKTGYTRAAGRILVSAAEKDGHRLVCVTIAAPDDWNDHRKLLDHGFGQFTGDDGHRPPLHIWELLWKNGFKRS